jgi:mycothiol synthase
MFVRCRDYQDVVDFLRIASFFAECYALDEHLLDWQACHWNHFYLSFLQKTSFKDALAITPGLQLWEEDHEGLIGVANVDAYGYASMVVHPKSRALYEDELFDWIEWYFSQQNQKRTSCLSLSMLVHAADTKRARMLVDRGLIRLCGENTIYRYSFEKPIPISPLPQGYAVQTADCNGEVLEQVEQQRLKKNPGCSDYDMDTIACHPNYCPDLDLAAVGPDGKVIMCCLAWYDRVNRIGEIEPLQFDPRPIAVNLSKALLAESLRRMQSLGCRIVYTRDKFEYAGTSIYGSVGFEERAFEYLWLKDY